MEQRNLNIPIECKAALKIKMTHLRGLRAYLESYDLKFGVVVSFAPYQQIQVDGRVILNIPAYLFSTILGNGLDPGFGGEA